MVSIIIAWLALAVATAAAVVNLRALLRDAASERRRRSTDAEPLVSIHPPNADPLDVVHTGRGTRKEIRSRKGTYARRPPLKRDRVLATAADILWTVASRVAQLRVIGPQTAAAFVYSTLAVISLVLAYLLRYDFTVPVESQRILLATLPLFVVARLAATRVSGLLSADWRQAASRDVGRLLVANVIGTGMVVVLVFLLLPQSRVATSIYIIELFLYTWFIAGVWIVYRTSYEIVRQHEFVRRSRGILIVGKGPITKALVAEILDEGSDQRVFVVSPPDTATVDPDAELEQRSEYVRLLSRYDVDRIILVGPELNTDKAWQAWQEARMKQWPVQIVPMSWTGRGSVLRTLRDVTGKDFLRVDREAAAVG